MKKINLIEWLWKTDSHEKQKVRGMQKYCILLLLLFTCVTHAWADNTSDGTMRLFFNMNAVDWWIADSGNQNFAYFFNNTTNKNAWSAHSVQQTGNYYYVVVPAGTWEGVILTRNNTTTSPSWDNKWNQTGDITWTSGKNYISSFSENSTSATLSTYQLTSTASLSASSTSITTAQTSTLTPSLTSNTDYNAIKSTSYSVTTNPGSAGSMSGNVFSATAAGTYTVTATVTYNAKGFSGITKTATATKNITVTAASTYTLSYNGNGNTSGTAPSSSVHAKDASATVAGKGDLAMSNYTFGGWNTSQYITGTDYAASSSITMSSDITLYAKWTRTVTLDQNGATTNSSPTSVTGIWNCSTLPTITNPSKDYYTFQGWNTKADVAGSIVINTSGAYTSNKPDWTDASGRFARSKSKDYATLYAKWTQSVTLKANTSNHGSGTDQTATATWNYTTISIPTHCTPADGYKLEGYYSAATGGTKILNADGTYAGTNVSAGGDTYISSSKWAHAGTTTLWAHYEPKTIVRLYTSNPDNWGTVYAYVWEHDTENNNAAWPGENITSNTVVRSGETFYYVQYYKEDYPNWDRVIFNDGSSNQTSNITFSNTTNNGQYNNAGKNETGSWQDLPVDETTYSVTCYAGAHGSITAKGTPIAANSSATVQVGATARPLSASPAGGYYFAGWTKTGSVAIADASSTSTTMTATGTGSVYAHWAEFYLTAPSSSRKTLHYAGNPLTISVHSALPDGCTNIVYSYEYKLSDGSWTAISPASSSVDGGDASCVWNTPSATDTKTYQVRGKVTYNFGGSSHTLYTAESENIVVVGTGRGSKTIKVKKPDNWDTFDGLHLWGEGSGIDEIGWPGYSIQVHHLGGKWYEFVIPDVINFILNNGVADNSSNPDKYQTVDLKYADDITNGYCYVLDNKTDASDGKYSPQKTYKYNLTRTENCPEAPTVSASAATNITNVSATLNGRISDDGNDAITEYGFYCGTTSACANKQVKGTSFTPDNTYTHGLTGLTAGNTIYFKAFAKNGLGETVTSPATSFTVPYKVTITQPTGCSAITPGTGTQYVRVGDNIVATAATGYSFSSWSTTNATLGTPSTVTGVTTSAITALSADNGTIEPVYTPNTYTVSFDVNGGTASTPSSKEVTYDAAYGTLPGGMTHTSKQFIGWYTDPDDGEGDLITAETIVSTASNHTLYAHYENVYSVNVNFKCGEASIYPSTSVEASPTSLRPTITAPEVFGYSFVNWTGSSVTFADASSATTTITATAATSVTANYSVVPTVYFKNNLGWENVYVTFDNGWSSSAPTNYGKPYFQMTQIGSSDIYYCVIPSAYTASDYASWAWNIAFDNTGFESSENVGTHSGGFNTGEFTGRGDFDPRTTMFIPYNGETETRNGGTFYTTGCWIQYNSTYSGYKVKVNSKVQGGGGTETVAELRSNAAGSTEFTATANLTSANYTYGVMLYKDYQKNTTDIWFTNVNDEEHTITAETTSLPWAFYKCDDSWQRCRVKTEALGDYKITVSFATGKPMVDIEYPVTVGDWKLIYKDLATWSDDAHTASWCHPSRVIKAKADAEDIVSFFVAYGSTPSIELHKCTAIDEGTGAQTWEKQGADLDLSDITATGIYNFKVTQDGSKNATAAYDGEYEGNFYIRTDASDGGWTNYKSSGKNLMTYSEYSLTHGGDFGPYSHYFMRFASKGTNIKFCIANEYSEAISDTVVSDTYTNEYIDADGNVRFMWNSNTNKIGRTYISGSTVVSDRFLVLEGDEMMFDESGNELTTAGGGKIGGLNEYEMNFGDDQNWIYEATVKAKPGARIKLTAKYNNKIQYFYGKEGDRSDATTDVLIGGEGTDKYKMRIVYDFKTNRLMRAFIPDGTITTDLAINADMMIIREHQQDAQQISFSEDGALSKVKTVYGAMKFNKYTVNGKEKTDGHAATGASRYERDLFYISFPFDVKLGEAFGFGEYGKHWIIEYYDGKGRAEKGFWADSKPNWKFVMPAQRNSFTMKAFEGYILALELDEMTESSSIWDNGVEDVYVYFPSDGDVNNIEATNRQITIDQTGYECTINRNTPDGNRTVKDSYWHCIGVPSFANYSSALKPTADGETIDWRDDDGDWSTPNLPYLYEWNRVDNSLSVTTSATFSFKATWSYLVQYAGTSIYWSQVNVTPASIVARKRTAPTSAEFRIELQKDGQKADQTFVRLTEEENVTTGFDFNYDLSKEFNKNKPNIYSLVTTVKEGVASVTQSAANVLPMTEQTAVIPVGVKIAAAGDYTFAIPEGTNGVGVTLVDNETGVRTNLSALDYTINLSAGTYDERFVLEISPIMQTPTGIEQIGSDDANGARKMLIDGVLYIVKDGKIFDAQGRQVK